MGGCFTDAEMQDLKEGCVNSGCEGCEEFSVCPEEESKDKDKGALVGGLVAGTVILFVAFGASTSGIVYFISKRKHVKLEEEMPDR